MRRKTLIRTGIAGLIALVLAYQTYAVFFVAAQGLRIGYGETQSGNIGEADEAEEWTFEGVRGDVVTVRVVPADASALLPSVTLNGVDGALLLEIAGTPNDPAVSFTLALQATGVHHLSVRGLEGSTGAYTLSLELLAAGEPPSAQEGVLVYGRSGTGEITDEVFRQFWSFHGTRGDVVDVYMTATSGDLDAYVTLLTPQGDVLANSDGGGASTDAAIYGVRLPTTGTYTIIARRAGAARGERGNTQGRYELAVALRSAGAEEPPTPTALALGRQVRGQLNADLPTMLYSVQVEGTDNLALALTLSDPNQIATLSVLTPQGALLKSARGVSPLYVAADVPQAGTYWVEVAAAPLWDSSALNFALTTRTLAVPEGVSQPLGYGRALNAPPNVDAPTHLHFWGRAGDLVAFSLTPYQSLASGDARILAPDGTLLAERAVQNGFSQALALEAEGIYAITLPPEAASVGYTAQVQQIGVAGGASAQHLAPQPQGTLPSAPSEGVSGEVRALEAHAWTLDAQHAQTWRFTLDAPDAEVPLVLAVQGPDGARLAQAVTVPLTGRAALRVELPAAGRYRALVIAPEGAPETAYTLRAQPDEGGTLAPQAARKGVLTATAPVDVWTVEAAPDALLSVQVRTQANATAQPDVHIIAPDGSLAASTRWDAADADALRTATGTGGSFRVLVQQAPTDARLVYTITADVTASAPTQTAITTAPVPAAWEVFETPVTPAPRPPAQVNIAEIVTPPLTANSPALQNARALDFEALVRGEIAAEERYQAWTFSARQDQVLGFSVTALEDASGPDLIVLDADGRVIAEKFVDGQTNNYLMQRFVAGGRYTLAVKLDGGGRYTLWVDRLSGIEERVPNVPAGQALDYGQTVADQLLGPDDVRTFVFYGEAGDAVRAHAVSAWQQTALRLGLLTPEGEEIASAEATVGDDSVTLETALPASGVYYLAVTGSTLATNAVEQFTLHLAVTRTEQARTPAGGLLGDAQTAILSAHAPTHRWLFTAQAGERVSVQIAPYSANSITPLTLQLADASGNVFLQREAHLGNSVLALPDVLLPRTGVYQVIVSGGQRRSGMYRLTLSRDPRNVQDRDYSVAYGETVGRVLSRQNFLDVWTFAGSQGDVLDVSVRAVRGDEAAFSVQLRSADGQALATVPSDALTASARVEGVVLPATGYYSIAVGNMDTAFAGQTAYELTLLLRGTAAHAIGTRMRYDQPVEGALYVDDPADVWVFDGAQGDVVTAWLAAESAALRPTLTLLATDWHVASAGGELQVLTATQADESGTAQLSFALPADGVFALLVQDLNLHGGNYRLHLSRQAEPAPPTLLRADHIKEGQIATGATVERWRFQASPGDTVRISVSPNTRTLLVPRVLLLAPDGQVLASADAREGTDAAIGDYTLPRGGDFTLLVTRALGEAGRTEGRYSVSLQLTPAPTTAAYLTLPATQRGTLDTATPTLQWVFVGQAQTTVRATLEATSGDLDPVLRIYDAGGTPLAAGDDTEGLDAEALATLPADGTYIVEASRYGGAWGQTEGNFVLNLGVAYQAATNAAPAARPIAYGDRVAGAVDAEQRSAAWTFVGVRGDVITARVHFPTDDAPLALYLRDAAGNALATAVRSGGTATLEAVTLEADGLYTLNVRRPGDAASSYSPYALELTLDDAAAIPATSGGVLTPGAVVVGDFSEAAPAHTWFWYAQAGDAVSLALTMLEGPLAFDVMLLAPDGSAVFALSAPVTEGDAWSSGTLRLPLGGLYALRLHAHEGARHTRYRLLLQPAALTAEAQPLTLEADGFGHVNATAPRQMWRFQAQAGETFSVRVAALTGDLRPTLTLWSADQRLLAEGVREGAAQAYIATWQAPADGDYFVVVGREGDVNGTTSGAYRIMLRQRLISANAARAQAIVLGESVRDYADGATPPAYVFQAAEGDVVAVAVQRIEGAAAPVPRVETEAGDVLRLPVTQSDGENAITALPVPATGRYVVVLEGAAPADYRLSVVKRPQEAQEGDVQRILGRGQVFSEGILAPEQSTFWTFSGERGEVLSFTVDTTTSALRADVTLFGPRGFVGNAVEAADAHTVTLGPVRLPESGDYVLVVRPWLGAVGGTTGRFSVKMEEAAADVSGSEGGHVLAYGQIVTGGLVPSDAEDVWTFDGHAGETVSVRAEHAPTDGTLTLTLLAPDGAELAHSQEASAYLGAMLGGVQLPADGLYSVRVAGALPEGASIEYRLTVLADAAPFLSGAEDVQSLRYGETRTDAVASGAFRGWTFYGQAGERVRCVVTPQSADFAPVLYLLAPDGEVLRVAEAQERGSRAKIVDYFLPSGGFYRLVVGHGNASQATTGDYEIALDRAAVGASDQGALADIAQATLTRAAPVHVWTFVPQASGHYTAQVSSQTLNATPGLALADAAGKVLAAGTTDTYGRVAATAYLEQGGHYQIVVSAGLSAQQMDYTLRMDAAAVSASSGVLLPAQPEVGHLSGAHVADEWQLEGRAGQTLTLTVTRAEGDLTPALALYDPIGLPLQTVTADTSGTLTLSLQLPADGTYKVLVTQAEGVEERADGWYRIAASLSE